MTAEHRLTLIDTIRKHRATLRIDVPEHAGTFLGHAIRIELDLPRHRDDPRPESRGPLRHHERDLILSILRHLPDLLLTCEREFNTFTPEPVAGSDIINPVLWLDRTRLEAGRQWSFVIGLRADPGHGWHIEFDGLEFSQVWSGG